MIYLIPWGLVLAAALVANLFPTSMALLFTLNVWCLSMPHSFSTFTRSDLRTRNIAISGLILFSLFFLSLSGMMYTIGFVTIYSFYFYWQQFHYTKQNMGIGIWKTKTKTRNKKDLALDYFFYFFVAINSIAASFYGGGIQFFGYSLINPFYFSVISPGIALGLNAIVLASYLFLRPAFWKMALTHTLIYSFAYLTFNNFVMGWILLNIFHNSQYLFFMNSEEKNHKFFIYAAGLSVGFYFILHASAMITLSIAFMLSMNFTHYVFDGFIWKKKFRNKAA